MPKTKKLENTWDIRYKRDKREKSIHILLNFTYTWENENPKKQLELNIYMLKEKKKYWFGEYQTIRTKILHHANMEDEEGGAQNES